MAHRHPELAAQVDRLCSILNADVPEAPRRRVVSQTDPVAARRAAATQWAELVSTIRTLPGLDRYGRPSAMDELRAAAGQGAIVAANTSDRRCDALILTARTRSTKPCGSRVDLGQNRVN